MLRKMGVVQKRVESTCNTRRTHVSRFWTDKDGLFAAEEFPLFGQIQNWRREEKRK
jgi:hypothetical protein